MIMQCVVLARGQELTEFVSKSTEAASAIAHIVKRGTKRLSFGVETTALSTRYADLCLEMNRQVCVGGPKPPQQFEQPRFGAAHAKRVKDLQHAASWSIAV
jgi:hypothetical protein